MELIEVILSKENLNRAYKKVVSNKGASGVGGITVEELGDYIRENKDTIVTSIRNRTYVPKLVRRVYIPKDNGKQRPLGITTVLDRTIQQAIAQPISDIYEEIFSEYSYGFRPDRSCHDAIRQALCYLNEGYEWVVDIDIEQFFDRVNHDKLIQILREQVNDSTTLNLIRKYLKAGVMEKGLEKATITGVPQGGPLSVVCSNVYLDKLDKELEKRGLCFTRYVDDVLIFTKSEMAANRVMKSICSWLERKLLLKVNATKTKVVRPTRSKYLGFTFLKNGSEWKVRPTNEKKKKLKKKLNEYLKRGKAVARPLAITIKRVNEIVRGWINYFRIGMTKGKDKRKYIGIVFEVKGIKYFAPLSSFKKKHKQMKESVDFIKIKDYAVINLNNMIPVPNSQIVDIDINKEKDASYRYLLQAESREVNRQKNRIRKNAEIVYSHKKHNGVTTPLSKRTNDFELLEKFCKEYG